MQAAAILTVRRTFNHLTSRHASIHKHDAKGDCHDPDQDSKERFQIPHSAALYQQQEKGVHGCYEDACRVDRQAMRGEQETDCCCDDTACGSEKVFDSCCDAACKQMHAGQGAERIFSKRPSIRPPKASLTHRHRQADIAHRNKTGTRRLSTSLWAPHLSAASAIGQNAPCHHRNGADSTCALQSVLPAQSCMAYVDSSDAGDVSQSTQLMLLLLWQTSAIREPKLPRGDGYLGEHQNAKASSALRCLPQLLLLR